jgi:hypothetical protein
MKIDFKKIINIKNKSDLKNYSLKEPIFNDNYLFHYLILVGNIDALKLEKFPVYIENTDSLNGFHLAAKEYNFDILCYLIDNYKDYIYNRNSNRETFAYYLPLEEFNKIIKKYPKLNWTDLIENGTKSSGVIFKNIIYNLNYKDLKEFISLYRVRPEHTNQYLLGIVYNTNLKTEEKIGILDQYSDDELNIKNQYGGGLIFAPIKLDDIKLFDYLLSRNVDVNYYTFLLTEEPLREALYTDILNNMYKYSKKILEKIKSFNNGESNKEVENFPGTLFSEAKQLKFSNFVGERTLETLGVSNLGERAKALPRTLFSETKQPNREVENFPGTLETLGVSNLGERAKALSRTDKYIDNILHSLFYIRLNRNKMITAIDTNYDPDNVILDMATDDMWNQYNIEHITPLNLVTNLDFSIYSPIIKKKNISVDPDIIKNLEKTGLNQDWIKLFISLPKYTRPKVNIKMEDYKYSDGTLFQAKFKDVGIFTLYLSDTYKDMIIPNMESYLLDDITFEDSFPFSDPVIAKTPVFPWTICYYSADEYYIHPYLNNIINGIRRKGDKRFALVFLSIIFDKTLHANVLLYDFKNMTIERFEPYGNSNVVDTTLDDMLEEELTWSTGLTYLRPGDYMPVAGFQTISDENNDINKKAGDFGGFCLAWCLWYVESRLRNSEIHPKDLVDKLLQILTNGDLKFSEYIRNYSNKINEKRIKYLEKIGIDMKEISNIHLSHESNNILTDFLINKFSSL